MRHNTVPVRAFRQQVNIVRFLQFGGEFLHRIPNLRSRDQGRNLFCGNGLLVHRINFRGIRSGIRRLPLIRRRGFPGLGCLGATIQFMKARKRRLDVLDGQRLPGGKQKGLEN